MILKLCEKVRRFRCKSVVVYIPQVLCIQISVSLLCDPQEIILAILVMNCIVLSASAGSRINLTAGLVVDELQHVLKQTAV